MSPVSGLKPCEINMALCVLDALFASESTILDTSNCLLSLNRGGICAIFELRSRTNPKYCLAVRFQGFSVL